MSKPVHHGIILAGGTAQKLRKFEAIKPLIKVGGKPLIVWTIEQLEQAGIKRITIFTDVDAALLHREVLMYVKPKAQIEYRQLPKTRNLLETLAAASIAITEPSVVIMCDLIFVQNPLRTFVKRLRAHEEVGMLVGTNERHMRESGATAKVCLARDGAMVSCADEAGSTKALGAGVYFFTPEGVRALLRHAQKSSARSFDEALLSHARTKPVGVVASDTLQWFDINTPATLIKAELFVRAHEESRDRRGQAPGVQPLPKMKTLPRSNRYRYPTAITFDVNFKRGLLAQMDDYEVIPYEAYYSPHFVIVDRNIDELYGEPVCQRLRRKGYLVHKITVNPGEWTKGVETYLSLVDEILTTGIDKKSTIVAVGGGVIKDLAGFIASTLYRGIKFIAIPTTVLAQCDAAITPKQGINGSGGKNLIGSYHAPLRVVCDPEVLKTLDRRYVADGLAECLKQACAQDKTFFEFFDRYDGDLQDVQFLERAIRRSIELKIDSFQKDLSEEKEALVNQYGHEVGHAVEFLSSFSLAHGESVALGMRASAELAHLLGIMDEETLAAHKSILAKYELPINIPRTIDAEDVLDVLRYHKKSHSSEARLVLVRRIGELWHEGAVYTKACDTGILRDALMRSYDS